MTELKPKKTTRKRNRAANPVVEKTAAERRAEIIRQTIQPGVTENPGQVVGGHIGWHYVVLPSDMDPTHRQRLERKLEMRGFELETDPAVTVSGHYKPTLWKIPQEIHAETRAAVKKAQESVDRRARQKNIL